MMNLLDFPNEILLSIYQDLDLKSKGRMRKTCQQLNQTFLNPKNILTKELAEKWDEAYKKILGLNVLNQLYQMKNVIITNPLGRYHMIFFLYSIDVKQKQLLFSVDYSGYKYIHELKQKIPELDFETHSEAYPNGEDSGVYGVLKLKNQPNIQDNLDFHCNFLFELFMLLVCKPQHKNKKTVTRYQLSQIINSFPNHNDPMRSYSFVRCFTASGHPSPPSPSPTPDSIEIQSKIKSEIQQIFQDLNQLNLEPSETFEFYQRSKL